MIRDALGLGWLGLRGRPARAAMSAVGIAVGLATLVLVIAIPASGQADLDRRLDALGTNVLVAQGSGASGAPVRLPEAAAAMVRRVGPVESATAVANLNQPVLRTDLADPTGAAGITALAATPDLLATLSGDVASGVFLTDATAGLPAVVLGHTAAQWLGMTDVDPAHAPRIRVGPRWFSVVGVLGPMPLTPELEQSALVGWDAARTELGFDGHPTVVYLTAAEQRLEDVRAVLPATLDPVAPGLVSVSRPSDALAAKRAAQDTFGGLFLGLAGVALLVGGIGVANTMVVSVLERRHEIGMRRALGATRGAVRLQFLVEAVLLSVLGAVVGTSVGVVGALAYAAARGWPVVVPPVVLPLGVLGAVVVGALAGLWPAVRAARLSPTEALAAV